MTLGKAEGRSAVSHHVLRLFSDRERLPFPDLFWTRKGNLSPGFPGGREIDDIVYLYRHGIHSGEAILADQFSCERKLR